MLNSCGHCFTVSSHKGVALPHCNVIYEKPNNYILCIKTSIETHFPPWTSTYFFQVSSTHTSLFTSFKVFPNVLICLYVHVLMDLIGHKIQTIQGPTCALHLLIYLFSILQSLYSLGYRSTYHTPCLTTNAVTAYNCTILDIVADKYYLRL